MLGDEVLNRIIGKEFFEFSIKLAGKSFIMRSHKHRFIERLYI